MGRSHAPPAVRRGFAPPVPMVAAAPVQFGFGSSNVSPMVSFGALLATLYVFFTYSRTLEFFPIKAGPLSLTVALNLSVLAMGVLSGGLGQLLRSKIAMPLFLLTGWMLLGIPFSSWKGGSVDSLLHQWLPVFLGFIGVSSLVHSLTSARRMMYALGFASVAILVFSRVFGSLDANSRITAANRGTLGNTNDLAMLLLLGLPGVVLYIQESQGLRRMLSFVLTGALLMMLGVVAQTGSRGGLIITAIYAFMLVFSASALRRAVLLIAVVVGTIVFFSTAPASTLARYRTILPFLSAGDLSAADAEQMALLEGSAAGSTLERLGLLQMSVDLTLSHPVFGVGVGTFSSAAAAVSKESNQRASWHDVHNSYMQIASECGIPALIAYLAAFVGCLRSLGWVRKRTRDNPQCLSLFRMANCMYATFICAAVAAFFSPIAYVPAVIFVAAIIDGFHRVARNLIENVEPVVVPRFIPRAGPRPAVAR